MMKNYFVTLKQNFKFIKFSIMFKKVTFYERIKNWQQRKPVYLEENILNFILQNND